MAFSATQKRSKWRAKPRGNNSSADLGFEAKLWSTADKLRSNMDAGEHKHVVLGLIFLKYISDTFEHHEKLKAGKGEYSGANAEDPDEYKAENVFFSSDNLTNIWVGYGARKWAVSTVDLKDMRTRETKSMAMPIGAVGLIWCSAPSIKAFTMPFRIASEPQWRIEEHIWPEPWSMPFDIEPLGSPARRLQRGDAQKLLECLKTARSVTDVFFIDGTCAFVPSHIPEEDWQIMLEELSDKK